MRTEAQFAKAFSEAKTLALAHKKSFWVVPNATDYDVSAIKPNPDQPFGTTSLEVTYAESLLAKARDFAITKHGDQPYGSRPYIYHLQEVALLVERFGLNARVLAFLHDVVEDTDTNLDEIERNFGKFIAGCVSLLTDEPGLTRSERKSKTFEKMSKVNGLESLALVVKVADRLTNTKASLEDGRKDLLKMYRAEYPAFRQACYREGMCEDLWEELHLASTSPGLSP